MNWGTVVRSCSSVSEMEQWPRPGGAGASPVGRKRYQGDRASGWAGGGLGLGLECLPSGAGALGLSVLRPRQRSPVGDFLEAGGCTGGSQASQQAQQPPLPSHTRCEGRSCFSIARMAIDVMVFAFALGVSVLTRTGYWTSSVLGPLKSMQWSWLMSTGGHACNHSGRVRPG